MSRILSTGGMHGGGGHAWQGGYAWRERRSLQWTLRILLECVLVIFIFLVQGKQCLKNIASEINGGSARAPGLNSQTLEELQGTDNTAHMPHPFYAYACA